MALRAMWSSGRANRRWVLRHDGAIRNVIERGPRLDRSRRLQPKSGFNFVTKCLQNSPRQFYGFALRKTARMAIRDSKFGICKSLAGATLHIHTS